MSGAAGTNAGRMRKCRAHSSRTRPAEVRELTSSAIDWTRSLGWRVHPATESTAPSDALDTSGTTA